MTHTPEPWEYETGPALNGRYHTVVNSDGHMICECWDGDDEVRQEADAKRIVACVNACAGIADPAQLRADRDALLEAAEAILEHKRRPSEQARPGGIAGELAMWADFAAAIAQAQAKGGV